MWFLLLEIFFWVAIAFALGFLFGWWGRSLLGFEKVSSRQVRYLRKLLINERRISKELRAKLEKGSLGGRALETSVEERASELGDGTAGLVTEARPEDPDPAGLKKLEQSNTSLTGTQSGGGDEPNNIEVLPSRSAAAEKRSQADRFSARAPAINNIEDNLGFEQGSAAGDALSFGDRAKAASTPVSASLGESAAKRADIRDEATKALANDAISESALVASDDLTRIKGIGAKLAQMLADRGIDRFSRLANMSDEACEQFENDIGFPERIRRERWREQAVEAIKSA